MGMRRELACHLHIIIQPAGPMRDDQADSAHTVKAQAPPHPIREGGSDLLYFQIDPKP